MGVHLASVFIIAYQVCDCQVFEFFVFWFKNYRVVEIRETGDSQEPGNLDFLVRSPPILYIVILRRDFYIVFYGRNRSGLYMTADAGLVKGP